MSLLPLMTLMSIPGPAASGGAPAAPNKRPLERFALYFTVDSAELSEISKARLDETAHRLGDVPLIVVNIAGYGPAGSPGLGEQRAGAARNYLVEHHGIDPGRITTSGQVGDGEPQDREAVVALSIP